VEKLLLIDGNSIMNRGFFALPVELTNSKGIHTNAILGFLSIFFRIYEEEHPTHIAVAFDVHQPTFRHKQYPEYKGTRHPMADELREQFPIIKEILKTMHINCLELGGYEADDIIGTMSRIGEKNGMEVTILSGDRDLLQLATEQVMIRIPKTKMGKTTIEDYHAKDVEATYGVDPIAFIEMKGLMGDSSDNIPGVPGIGPKTAEKLIVQYKTVENLLANIDTVKPDGVRKKLEEHKEDAVFSRDLSRIFLEVPIEDQDITHYLVTEEEMLSAETYKYYVDLELRSLLKKFDTSKFGEEAKEEKIQIQFALKELNAVKELPKCEHVGFYPIVVDGIGIGAVVSAEGVPYLLRMDPEKVYREIVNKTTVSILDLKEYISLLNIKENDNVFDAALAAYLVNPLKGEYPYHTLLMEYFGVEVPDEKSIIGKSEMTIFASDDPDFQKLFALIAEAADFLYDPLREKLSLLGMKSLYEDVEHPMIFVLREMEDYGIRLDKEGLSAYGEALSVRISELTKEIYEYCQVGEFNINSTKQLGVILFEKLNLGLSLDMKKIKTKTGYSTNVEVLTKLKDEHPVIPLILEYRQLTKLLSTYVEGLLNSVASDGRIHSKFQQMVTATGRLSSTEPNLQNIPMRTELGRDIRKAFIPADRYHFVDADYSQIELRVMAHLSDDKALIEAFNSEKDIHSITASQVFHVPLSEVDSDLRRKAKAVNFGIIYGISSFGLGEDLGISKKEAQEYINQYYESYSGVKDFLDRAVRMAKEEGVVRTMLGRIRPIPELKSSNFMQRSFGERIAMNSPIQGSAADIMKLAMVKVRNVLKERNMKSRLILQIHDELLIEAADDEISEVQEILRDSMENAVKLSIPLYVDMHTGENLYDAK